MKKLTKLRTLVVSFILVAFALSGCASQIASRSIPVQIGSKEHSVQLKGTKSMTTTLGLYVDGVKMGDEKTFSPFSSSHTFTAELEKYTLEVPCAWEATSNGWGSKADCSLFRNNQEVAKFPTF